MTISRPTLASAPILIGLQYLRGVAALLVLLDHVGGMIALPGYVGQNPLPTLGFGAIGVDIFFTISGFIIMVACYEAQTLRPRITLVPFLLHRFARIIPFLWVCVIAFALVRWVGKGFFEWAPYIRSLTLWPLGEVRPNVVWTLRHEALFYLMFAVCMLWLRRPMILAIWCISPLLSALANWKSGELCSFVFNPVNIEFGAGVAAGWFYLKEWSLFQRPTWQSLGSTLALAAAALELAAALNLGIRSVPNVILIAVISMGLVIFAAFQCRDFRVVRATGLIIGNASYSIYLTHPLTVLAGLEIFRRFVPQLNVFLLYGSLTIGGILGGIAIHITVERPLVRRVQSALGLKKGNRSGRQIPRFHSYPS